MGWLHYSQIPSLPPAPSWEKHVCPQPLILVLATWFALSSQEVGYASLLLTLGAAMWPVSANGMLVDRTQAEAWNISTQLGSSSWASSGTKRTVSLGSCCSFSLSPGRNTWGVDRSSTQSQEPWPVMSAPSIRATQLSPAQISKHPVFSSQKSEQEHMIFLLKHSVWE